MPIGEGWWLRIVDALAVPVDEHAAAIADDPEQYGLTKKDVEGLNPFSNKDKNVLRKMALKKGWGRVRSAGLNLVYEFDYTPVEDAMFALLDFMEKQGFGPKTNVDVHDIARHQKFSGTFEELANVEKLTQLIGVTEVHSKLECLLKRLGKLLT